MIAIELQSFDGEALNERLVDWLKVLYFGEEMRDEFGMGDREARMQNRSMRMLSDKLIGIIKMMM